MTWLLAIALALAAFALAAFAFKLARGLWTSLLAALAFGLAGYAMQASPGLPAAPKSNDRSSDDVVVQIVEMRGELVEDDLRSRNPLMTTADAYARQGRYSDAAAIAGGITANNPQDFDAWLALGNALSEHAGGALTPASLYAYQKASELRPDHPAPGYFLGVSLIRQGRMMEARQVWREALGASAEGAPGRLVIAGSLARLDEMLGIAPPEGAEPGPVGAPAE